MDSYTKPSKRSTNKIAQGTWCAFLKFGAHWSAVQLHFESSQSRRFLGGPEAGEKRNVTAFGIGVCILLKNKAQVFCRLAPQLTLSPLKKELAKLTTQRGKEMLTEVTLGRKSVWWEGVTKEHSVLRDFQEVFSSRRISEKTMGTLYGIIFKRPIKGSHIDYSCINIIRLCPSSLVVSDFGSWNSLQLDGHEFE